MAEALNLLKKDHRTVQKILEELAQTTSRATHKRKELLNTLKQELKLHEKIEEKLFYPKMKQKKDAKDLVLEAYEEHHLVDDLLEKLEETEVNDEAWLAKITVLKENLMHHIHEEEHELFPKAKADLGAKKLQEMGSQIERMKKDAS